LAKETVASATDPSSKAPEERRERILRATVDVVRTRGFAGARVSDIAEAAGTSQGLVLYHFQSLAGALNAALTLLEDEFYDDLERDLQEQAGPIERLRHMADLGAGLGPAVGDWRLWLELWVRALHDPDARATRESLDRRWRAALSEVVAEGVTTGDFAPIDAQASIVRLASLMDGLAIQLALEDAEVTPERLAQLWWESAVLELRMGA
jgi:AcrR family transcriptional regulator